MALTPDREVVAQSTLAVAKGDGTDVFQWGTFVHREHRGHRLGLAVKVANLRAVQDALPARPGSPRRTARPTTTWSTSTSEIGFEPIEVSMEFFKRL